ncbi:MAG: LysM peptidoglycan-binding domain-containing protein [Bacteroidia bacterium]
MPSPKKTAEPPARPEEDFDGLTTEWVEHTVQPGETLKRISTMYGTKVDIIKLVNKLESDSISPGVKLCILANKENLSN